MLFIALVLIVFESFDLSLIQFLFFCLHIGDLHLGPQTFLDQHISDASEHVCLFVMYLL